MVGVGTTPPEPDWSFEGVEYSLRKLKGPPTCICSRSLLNRFSAENSWRRCEACCNGDAGWSSGPDPTRSAMPMPWPFAYPIVRLFLLCASIVCKKLITRCIAPSWFFTTFWSPTTCVNNTAWFAVRSSYRSCRFCSWCWTAPNWVLTKSICCAGKDSSTDVFVFRGAGPFRLMLSRESFLFA